MSKKAPLGIANSVNCWFIYNNYNVSLYIVCMVWFRGGPPLLYYAYTCVPMHITMHIWDFTIIIRMSSNPHIMNTIVVDLVFTFP